jgi:hypothetical protein
MISTKVTMINNMKKTKPQTELDFLLQGNSIK